VAIEKLKAERDALRAQLDTERERHKQTASPLAQYAPKTVDVPRAHPVPCEPPTASHDTPEGKAVAESASEDIRVGDMVEVFQKTGSCTFETDIGTRGTVLQMYDSCVDTAPLDGYLSPKGNHVALCDVRKVTP
jgi:hypothetical protein